jgi:hypothetical protein
MRFAERHPMLELEVAELVDGAVGAQDACGGRPGQEAGEPERKPASGGGDERPAQIAGPGPTSEQAEGDADERRDGKGIDRVEDREVVIRKAETRNAGTAIRVMVRLAAANSSRRATDGARTSASEAVVVTRAKDSRIAVTGAPIKGAATTAAMNVQ